MANKEVRSPRSTPGVVATRKSSLSREEHVRAHGHVEPAMVSLDLTTGQIMCDGQNSGPVAFVEDQNVHIETPTTMAWDSWAEAASELKPGEKPRAADSPAGKGSYENTRAVTEGHPDGSSLTEKRLESVKNWGQKSSGKYL